LNYITIITPNKKESSMSECIHIDREGNEFSNLSWLAPRYTKAAGAFLAKKFGGTAQYHAESGRKPQEGECKGAAGYKPAGWIVRFPTHKGDALGSYLRKAVGQIRLADGLYDFPPMRGITTLTFHRNPTASELKFGYGATHYRAFLIDECIKPNGDIKKWLKGPDGLRYYR
jgi:hypothetical protein